MMQACANSRCANEFEVEKKRGRPRKYCDSLCQKAAEARRYRANHPEKVLEWKKLERARRYQNGKVPGFCRT